jgi:hypothetical protein
MLAIGVDTSGFKKRWLGVRVPSSALEHSTRAPAHPTFCGLRPLLARSALGFMASRRA